MFWRSDAISVTPLLMFITMTDKEIKEYIEETEADGILSSLEWSDRDYIDCALPA